MPARRIVTLAVAMLVALAPTAGAQLQKLKGTTPEFRANLQTDMMKKRLELTPEQAPQVSQINLDAAKKMQPLIDGDEGPLREAAQARTIQNEREAALGKVLTPDQMTKYQAQKEEMRQKLMDRMLGGATPAR
jgi:Spy/CpxP family protein refolding chaperone